MGKEASPERVVQDIRRKTRRRFSAEEKIRIVLEGLRGFVNLPDAGRVAGQDPNLGSCSRSTRHHVPFGERSGAERAVMSGS